MREKHSNLIETYSNQKSLLEDGFEALGIDNLNDYYDPKLKHARLDQLTPYKKITFEKIDIANLNFEEGLMDTIKEYK